MLGVGISLVIFAIIRQFAKPPPKTMNAQYQALSNEYLKVNRSDSLLDGNYVVANLIANVCIRAARPKRPNPSLVYHLKVTKARE